MCYLSQTSKRLSLIYPIWWFNCHTAISNLSNFVKLSFNYLRMTSFEILGWVHKNQLNFWLEWTHSLEFTNISCSSFQEYFGHLSIFIILIFKNKIQNLNVKFRSRWIEKWCWNKFLKLREESWCRGRPKLTEKKIMSFIKEHL